MQAFVNLAVSPKSAHAVIERLSLLPALRQLAELSGRFDCLAVLRATTSVLLAMRVDRVA